MDGQWQAIVRDISERKAHQARNEMLFRQLEDERRWLQAVLDAVPIGVVLYRGERNAFYNRRSEELFGMKLSPTGSSAQYANRIFFSDGRAVDQSEVVSTRVLQHQQTVFGKEFFIERPDATRIPILGSAAPIYDERGRMMGGVGVFQDVSERMLAEQKIREERQLLKDIFDILPVGVWIADRDGRIILSNRAGDQIWQGTRHVGPEQFGEYKAWWVETGKPLTPDQWGIARAIRWGETSQSELLRIQCFDGSFKTVINWAAPIRAENGAITGAIAVNEDVTSLQHTQEQLRASVRDREDILAIVTQEGDSHPCQRRSPAPRDCRHARHGTSNVRIGRRPSGLFSCAGWPFAAEAGTDIRVYLAEPCSGSATAARKTIAASRAEGRR